MTSAICQLCDKELKKKKGENQKTYAYELQHKAHLSCIQTREGILRKHRISPNDYLNAVIEGLFLLSPELAETKSMKSYHSRMRKAEDEIEGVFPNLKKKSAEKKVEEKKEGEEKGEKDK